MYEELHAWLKTRHPLLRQSEDHRNWVVKRLVEDVPAYNRRKAFNAAIDAEERAKHLQILEDALVKLLTSPMALERFRHSQPTGEQQPPLDNVSDPTRKHDFFDPRSKN